MLNKLNSPITAFLALAGFLWLGWYSWQHNVPLETSYSAKERASMARLVAKVTHEKRLTPDNAAKMVYLFNTQEKE